MAHDMMVNAEWGFIESAVAMAGAMPGLSLARQIGMIGQLVTFMLIAGPVCLSLLVPDVHAEAGHSLPAITIHVDAGGGDDNADGIAQPVATLRRAQACVLEAVEQLGKNRKEKAGSIVVSIAPGTYVLLEPLVFDARYSASSGVGSITWRRSGFSPHKKDEVLADPTRQVILSGGKIIKGWTAHPKSGSDESKKHWVQTIVPDAANGAWRFRDLWVCGKPACRARTEGYFRVNKTGEDCRTNFTWNDDDLKPCADLPSVELVFLHDWSITRCPVASLDAETRTLRVPRQVGSNHFFMKINGYEEHARYYLENSIDFLRRPGQWQMDYTTGVLTYWLREGETIENLDVVAPGIQRLIEVKGTAEKSVEGLSFEGLTLMHAASVPERENTYWGIQAYFRHDEPDPETGKPAAVSNPYGALHMEFAHSCRFDYGLVTQMAGTGISLGSGCVGCQCAGTVVSHCGGNGIMIGHPDTPVTRAVETTPSENLTCDANVVRRNLLTECTVERTGRTYLGAVAVWIGMAEDTVIDRCEISNVPYTGISVGWRWDSTPTQARGQKITDNHIHHCMQILSDGGGIYTLGFQPGTALEGNLIHGIPRNAGRAQSNSIFLDDGTKGFVVRDNFIYDVEQCSPIRFHKVEQNDVVDNFLIRSKSESGEVVPMFSYLGTSPDQIVRANNVSEVDDIARAIRRWQEERNRKGANW